VPGLAVAAAAALVLLLAPTAFAASPGDFSASDQYVETVPTSRGPSASDDAKHSRTPLSAGAAAKLHNQGGADAASLEAIATSSDYGAPQAKRRDGKGGSSKSTPAVPSASVAAVRDSGADLLWLLLALFAVTGLLIGAVAYQRHRDSKTG
jgi:hypothetical protein